MKKLKLFLLPALLMTLVSCSSKSDGYSSVSNKTALDFYELVAEADNCVYNIKNLKIDNLNIPDGAKPLYARNCKIGYTSTDETHYTLLDLFTGSKIADISYGAFNSVFGMRSSLDKSVAYNNYILIYAEASEDETIHYVVSDTKGNVLKKFDSVKKVSVSISSNNQSPDHRYICIDISGDSEFNLYVNVDYDYNVTLLDSSEDYTPLYDKNEKVSGYVRFESNVCYIYDSKYNFIGNVDTSFMNDMSYIVYGGCGIYYAFKTEEYYDSSLNTPSKTTYKTYGYKLDLSKGTVSYKDNLPFVIKGSHNVYGMKDSKGTLVSYSVLNDGIVSDETYMSFVTYSSFNLDSSVVYDEVLFNSQYVTKLSKGKYLVSYYNNESLETTNYYVDKSNYMPLNVDSVLYGAVNQENIIVEKYNGYFKCSKTDFLNDYNKIKNSEPEYDYVNSSYLYNNQFITAMKYSDDEYMTSFGIACLKNYIGNITNFGVIINSEGIYDIGKNPIYKFEEGEKFEGVSSLTYYMESSELIYSVLDFAYTDKDNETIHFYARLTNEMDLSAVSYFYNF